LTKSEIRENMIKKRLEIPSPRAEAYSKKITNLIFEMPEYRRSRSIFIYMDFKNEVRTRAIIRDAQKSGKKVYHPVILEDERRMIAAMPVTDGDFRMSAYGIFEPDIFSSVICRPEDIDVAIVPGVAFDSACSRMGYGGGYYDAFFAAGSGIFKIGVCYEQQLLETIPNGVNDVCMDAIVTEERIIRRES
jgi:5-formyltetrahydrofolate cyclo-ligase